MSLIKFLALSSIIAAGTFAVAQNNEGKAAANRALFENNGSIHEAAKAAGGRFVTSLSNLDGWTEFQDLKALRSASSEVLVGIPTDNVCRVSADGREVQTAYQFRVEESLKGHFKAGDVVTVLLPGGRVSFEDGTTAQVNTPGFRKMVNGERYVVFVSRAQAKHEFVPTGGTQGIFELTADRLVKPFAKGQALSKESGRTENDFVTSVRNEAEKADN